MWPQWSVKTRGAGARKATEEASQGQDGRLGPRARRSRGQGRGQGYQQGSLRGRTPFMVHSLVPLPRRFRYNAVVLVCLQCCVTILTI